MRECGATLRPHLMDARILDAKGRPSSMTGGRLQAGKAADSAIASLWDKMAAEGTAWELEQEALQPVMPCF